jgi:translation initiation factor IF-2
MMDVPITKVIGTCMSLGIMVTMNQRLDAQNSLLPMNLVMKLSLSLLISEAIQVVEDEENLVLERQLLR